MCLLKTKAPFFGFAAKGRSVIEAFSVFVICTFSKQLCDVYGLTYPGHEYSASNEQERRSYFGFQSSNTEILPAIADRWCLRRIESAAPNCDRRSVGRLPAARLKE